MTIRFDLCGDSSGNYSPPICPDRRTSVVVIGGGVAGVWVAYQLIKARIDTTLITYQAEDRGGVQGASRRSAGAFNTSPLTALDLENYLQKVGHSQTHPSVAPTPRGASAKGTRRIGLAGWS